MLKKLSLMGLLVTVVAGTTAYGMDDRDPNEPKKTTKQRREERRAKRAQDLGQFFQRPEVQSDAQQIAQLPAFSEIIQAFVPEHKIQKFVNNPNNQPLVSQLAQIPGVPEAFGVDVTDLKGFQSAASQGVSSHNIDATLDDSAQEERNERVYGLSLTNKELAMYAANDPEELLISIAATDLDLEKLLVGINPDLKARINAWKQ